MVFAWQNGNRRFIGSEEVFRSRVNFIGKLLGHVNVASKSRYTHIADETLIGFGGSRRGAVDRQLVTTELCLGACPSG
jgi:hypothetical protein